VARQWAERLCRRSGASLPWTRQAEEEAVAWSLKKGDRSGRIAWQFGNHWVGSNLLRSRG
jgi:predicted AAA+ superfamily ATPase